MDVDYTSSTLTVSQEKAMALAPIFTSLLSVLGSSVIIYQVAYKSSIIRTTTPYQRLLLGLSSCDIVASLSYAIQAFAVPTDTSRRYYAIGNDTSCTILGAFTQFAFAAVWYNGFLSYYYLATIRFHVHPKRFAHRMEPIMHFLALGFSILTAVSGALFQKYGEAAIGPGCWVVDRCLDETNCTDWNIGWYFGGIPVLFIFVSIAVNNMIIFCHVRSSGTTTNTAAAAADGRRPTHHVQSYQERKVYAVATQAFGYVGTFFLCYLWAFLIKLLESFGWSTDLEAQLYPLLLLNSIFLPLQGFCNMLVYCRPSYIKYRGRYPNESKLWAFWHALLASELSLIQKAGGTNNQYQSKINPSSNNDTTSQTSVGTTGMGSSSWLFGSNNSGGGGGGGGGELQNQTRWPNSMISSALFSVEELDEASSSNISSNNNTKTGIVTNSSHFQDDEGIRERLSSSELCSDFEAELQDESSCGEGEEEDSNDERR